MDCWNPNIFSDGNKQQSGEIEGEYRIRSRTFMTGGKESSFKQFIGRLPEIKCEECLQPLSSIMWLLAQFA